MNRATFGRFAISALLLGASLGTASAADLAYKGLPPPPPPIPMWNGFYVGVNAGAGIGVNSTTQSATFSSTALGVNGLLSDSGSTDPIGALGGGQIGYNWEMSSIVFGVEADWQGSLQKASRNTCTPPASLGFFGAGANGFGYCVSNEQKITDIGTARARAGVDRQGTLWYMTGGFAWGTVKENDSFTGSASPVIFPGALQPGPFLPSAASFSSTRTGWTLGAGAETMIFGGWSAKLEYLYVDLGRTSNTFPIAINPAFGAAFTAGGVATATTTSHVTDNIVRFGLNYRFGGSVVPSRY